jgi:hypothetical protein
MLAQLAIDTTVRREHMMKAQDLHVENVPVIVVGSI